MLYTVVPLEQVFYQEPVPKKTIAKSNHCFIEVENGKVSAVCSTDPADYLKINIGDLCNNAE